MERRLLRRILRHWALARLTGDRPRATRQGRRLLFEQLVDHADEVAFTREGVTWHVPTTRDSVARHLFIDGRYQERDVTALRAWMERRGRLGPDRWIVDVGANLGVPSIPLARATEARVLAIEALPSNFRFLSRNVEANGLTDRVRCLHAAVATEAGSVTMVAYPERGASSEVEVSGGPQGWGESGDDWERSEVPALRLEDAVAKQGIAAESVALVWSDTQGFERQVLESGGALWEAGVPAYVELWPDGLEAHGGLDRLLEVAARHFSGFVGRDALREDPDAAAQPIDALPGLLRSLGRAHTDALLLPRG